MTIHQLLMGNRVATKHKRVFCRRNNFSIPAFLLAIDRHTYTYILNTYTHTYSTHTHIHSGYYGVKPGILLLLLFSQIILYESQYVEMFLQEKT